MAFGLAFGLYSYPSSGGESTSYSPRLAPAAQYCTDSPSTTLARAHSAATAETRPSNSVVYALSPSLRAPARRPPESKSVHNNYLHA